MMAWTVPDYSGGSVPDSHGIPYSPPGPAQKQNWEAPEFLVYYSIEISYVKDNFPSGENPAIRLEPLGFRHASAVPNPSNSVYTKEKP